MSKGVVEEQQSIVAAHMYHMYVLKSKQGDSRQREMEVGLGKI